MTGFSLRKGRSCHRASAVPTLLQTPVVVDLPLLSRRWVERSPPTRVARKLLRAARARKMAANLAFNQTEFRRRSPPTKRRRRPPATLHLRRSSETLSCVSVRCQPRPCLPLICFSSSTRDTLSRVSRRRPRQARIESLPPKTRSSSLYASCGPTSASSGSKT